MKSVLYVLDYLILRKVVDNYHYRTIENELDKSLAHFLWSGACDKERHAKPTARQKGEPFIVCWIDGELTIRSEGCNNVLVLLFLSFEHQLTLHAS